MKTPFPYFVAFCFFTATAQASWVSDALKLNAPMVQAISKRNGLTSSVKASPTKAADVSTTSAHQKETKTAPEQPDTVADERLRAYFESALKVVTSFESGDVDKFTDVTPDSDTQGLSLGLFGWNIKQGSLQPLVKRVTKTVVVREMPRYGEQFWAACTSSKKEGLKIVTSWQDITPGNFALKQCRKAIWKLEHREVVSELKHLLGSPEMRSIQMSEAFRKATIAWSLSCTWAQDSRGKGSWPTIREFTTFLDTIVQNGDMAGLGYSDVRRWTHAHSSYDPCQLVCRWLARTRAPDLQPTDANKNAGLWVSNFPKHYEKLLLLCWLRAQEAYASEGLVQPNVLCRRGTILANNGWVNGRRWEFSQLAEQPLLAQR